MINYMKLLVFIFLSHVAFAAKVRFAGINIAGFDFGCDTSGKYTSSSVTPPLLSQGNVDGAGQMEHFVSDDGLNIFRLPVCWQYLVNNKLGGNLDATNTGIYDELVQACLKTGAYCVIDIHNYARWNNQIVGQSGGAVTNNQLSSLWYQIAVKYKSNQRVIFGTMNEPHDLDINNWAVTAQESVTSIRSAGATSQMILLPGNVYAAAGSFVSSGSAAALNAIVNNDGTKTNLIFDIHQYLDAGSSGKDGTCTSTGTANLNSLATWLRSEGRQALLTETGGGSTSSCYTDVCAELDWMNFNTDVYLGWIGWAAGSFSTSYVLSETPTKSGGSWTDKGIVSNCIAAKF